MKIIDFFSSKNKDQWIRKGRSMFLYFLAVFFPVTEIVKQILLYTHYEVRECLWYFPFQLCSLPIYLMPLYVKTKHPAVETFLIDFSLLGGIFVFFDQSGMHYDLPILTWHSYLWHIMMIVTGLFLIFHSESEKTWKDFIPAAGLLLIGAVIATVLNLTLNRFGEINMFYISPLYRMNQVVFRDITARWGSAVTRALYLVCLVLGGSIFHALSMLIRRGLAKRKPQGH